MDDTRVSQLHQYAYGYSGSGSSELHARHANDYCEIKMMYAKYRNMTMCNEEIFAINLALAKSTHGISGAIVECGTWRGGMIAAIAETLGNDRKYILCDSFQGLPIAREIDGSAAMQWQKDDPNNCRASENEARECMRIAGITSYQ